MVIRAVIPVIIFTFIVLLQRRLCTSSILFTLVYFHVFIIEQDPSVLDRFVSQFRLVTGTRTKSVMIRVTQ